MRRSSRCLLRIDALAGQNPYGSTAPFPIRPPLAHPRRFPAVPAFVFPGQGAQRPGMGCAWIDHPSWEVVDDASETAGRDVGRLLVAATLDELTETRNAELATST